MQKLNYVIAFFADGANVRSGTSRPCQMAAADRSKETKTRDHLIAGEIRWFPFHVTIIGLEWHR